MAERRLRLGDLQLAIMKALWERAPLSVADVQAALADRKLAPTTIATMLRKMEERGLVRHRAEGRRFLYEPAVAESDVSRSMADHVLESVFEGSLAEMVSHLLRARDVSKDELARLAKLIADKKRKS
jgi:BlaI family transcriptional regulator, penicillinase repressor